MAAKMSKRVPDHVEKNPPDDQVLMLQRIAEAAGDDELVRLCGAALRDYATAREAILREIAYGPHAEKFREAVMAG